MNSFLKYFENINDLKNCKSAAVAVSGGIDSLSLVLLFNEFALQNNIKLVALTVDHKLRPTSTDEANYINELLRKNNIKHQVLEWNGIKPTSNVENIAREARYNLIFDFCRHNNIDTVLVGHHLQDQAENFLIRLFRGSNINGLSSMKMVSYMKEFKIIRPFLNVKKADLEKYLVSKNIKWIDDESNYNDRYLRNKIRNFLNSFDDRDNIIKRISRTVDTFQTANKIIDEYVNGLENIVYFYDKKLNYYRISLWEFLKLDNNIKYKIILNIIKNITGNYENPRFSKLERLVNGLNNLKKSTLHGCIFKKINTDYMVCYREYNSINSDEGYLKPGELNSFLKKLKEKNHQLYKELKDYKDYKREILYTLPIEKIINLNV